MPLFFVHLFLPLFLLVCFNFFRNLFFIEKFSQNEEFFSQERWMGMGLENLLRVNSFGAF